MKFRRPGRRTGRPPRGLPRPRGRDTPPDLAAHYAQVFDFKNRHCLYLSWWSDGDTRRRGLSLVRFKEVYREHGLEFSGEELPDFLPVMLEFSALTQWRAPLLQEHRAGLELLRLALTDFGTPYAPLLAGGVRHPARPLSRHPRRGQGAGPVGAAARGRRPRTLRPRHRTALADPARKDPG